MYRIEEELQKGRLLLLDGAMGTMLQQYGNNDSLCLTQPDVVASVHRAYLQAGADIITTNTFNAQRISLADFHSQHLVAEINTAAVRLARKVADDFSTPQKPRFVVASVGPTNKSLSMSPDISNPAMRSVTYDQLKDAYAEQIEALLHAGVDGILFETIFDTLNAKAGIHAFTEVSEQIGVHVPLMLSVTVNDKFGRLLSGQSLLAFLASVQHAPIFSLGLNCSFGAHDMLPCLRTLAAEAPYYISAYPNAGLPNELGQYDQTAQMMQGEIRQFVDEHLVNIIGGCCGTTPEHIKLLSQLVADAKDIHVHSKPSDELLLSGLDLLRLTPEVAFVNVGERCNVAGSKKFLRLIKEHQYDEAVSIARKQVEDGAMVLDINMDDGLLDAEYEMCHFVKLLCGEPDICKVPLMIDSSKWQVIRQALKCVQGKCIVNSISLKEGEEVFVEHAKEAKLLGAAVVVMAFDEQGQANTYNRRIDVCSRAYRILVDKVGMNPLDIIFDPNILAVATGMPEHNAYAKDFIDATAWIKKNLPGAHVSGGVSNLSFSFRGNNYIREAMHAIFLYHARKVGMDFGIVNPSAKVAFDDIPHELTQIIEEALLHPSDKATETLIEKAASLLNVEQNNTQSEVISEQLSVDDALIRDLQRGITETLEADLQRALDKYPKAVDIIEGPLMSGMNKVGQLFGEGKMFLPQVVKTARTMKAAVSILKPHIDAQRDASTASAGKVLLATVKGDVHDIGKNIVGIVMACNGYEIIDLGVMVSPEEILHQTQLQHPDIIGLSGLITPSLSEMIVTVKLLRDNGIQIPVMIGGATTSELHTALKIAPVYEGPVIWVKDASQNAPVSNAYLNPNSKDETICRLKANQQELRDNYHGKEVTLPLDEARKRKPNLF